MADKAIGELNAALQKNPNSVTALMALAGIYQSQKKNNLARENYQKVLKINPKFPPAANNLAYIYAEENTNIDEALALAQMAKEAVPDNPFMSDTLGWVYYRKNVYTRAIVYLKEAADKLPDQATVRYHLGMAYYKNGQVEQAKKELNRALQLDPNLPAAAEVKEILQKAK
jgi:Flp pilus assembly protein TadD